MNFNTIRKIAANKVVKQFKIKKYDAIIRKHHTKYIAYIDGDQLDVFTTKSAAEQGIKDFVELLGK